MSFWTKICAKYVGTNFKVKEFYFQTNWGTQIKHFHTKNHVMMRSVKMRINIITGVVSASWEKIMRFNIYVDKNKVTANRGRRSYEISIANRWTSRWTRTRTPQKTTIAAITMMIKFLLLPSRKFRWLSSNISSGMIDRIQ